jgi:hypothetical protein
MKVKTAKVYSNKKQLIDQITEVEEKIKELMNEKTELLNYAMDGELVDELKLVSQNSDGTWTRVTVFDNALQMNEGFWKSVKVERFSSKIETLKNPPKELKEVA